MSVGQLANDNAGANGYVGGPPPAHAPKSVPPPPPTAPPDFMLTASPKSKSFGRAISSERNRQIAAGDLRNGHLAASIRSETQV